MTEINPKLSAYHKLVYINRELFTMIENKISVDLLAYLYSDEMNDAGDKHLLNKERLYYRFVEQIMEEGKMSGEFMVEESKEELVDAYAMIERGLLCDWCIYKNEKSLTAISNKLMPVLLKGLLCPIMSQIV